MRGFVWVGVVGTLLPWQVLHAVPRPDVLLVGLYVDKVEKDTIDALKLGDQYYIPFDVFNANIGIEPSQVSSGWQYVSPIGTSVLPSSAILRHQDSDYVNIADTLEIGIPVTFNQSAYAIEIYPPWDDSDLSAQQHTQAPIDIDFHPQAAGINHISVSSGVTRQQTGNQPKTVQSTTQIGLTGNALSGLWGAQLNLEPKLTDSQKDTKDTLDIDTLYWATFAENTAWRMGANTNPSFDSAETSTFSGVSTAYSNQDITRHLAKFDQYNQRLLQNNFDDLRNITGSGPVGGIAELRVNGNRVARVRIGIDKRYEFRNLNLGQFYDANYRVEVALFEHNFSNTPLEIVPYRLAERKSNVSTGELLLEAGVGRRGNVLEKVFADASEQAERDKTTYAYSYAEYGLNNNISVRGSLTRAEHTAALLGINAGLSQTTNLDVSVRKTHASVDYEALLFYNAHNHGFNYQLLHREPTGKQTTGSVKATTTSNSPISFETESNADIQHRWFMFYHPNDAVQLSANVYHNEPANAAAETYYTASATLKLNDDITAQINRDRFSDMSYRVDWDIPNTTTRLSALKDKFKYGLTADHRLSNDTNVGTAWYVYDKPENMNGPSVHPMWYQGYIEHRLAPDSKVYANITGVNQSGGTLTGYQIGWQHRINDGLDFSLGYQRNSNQLRNINSFNQQTPEELSDDSSQTAIFARFNLSLEKLPRRGYAFSRASANNNGAILAAVKYDDVNIAHSPQMKLQLNNRLFTAKGVGDGQYLLNNVTPGLYRLSLDNDNLPIEYAAHDLPRPLIKVAHGATTRVPYQLEKRLGFSGKLVTRQPTKLAAASTNSTDTMTKQQPKVVKILQNGKAIARTMSNAFGYYQVLGLKPGHYQVNVGGYHPAMVNLSNDFVFEVDLQPRKYKPQHEQQHDSLTKQGVTEQ